MNHRSAVRSSAAFLTAMLMTVPARAGEGPTAEAGQRVRVTAAVSGLHGVVVGTLLKVGPQTLTVADSERGAVTELPLASILRLEVSQGRRRHTRQGLLMGMAAGLALAPLVWADKQVPCGDAWNPRECTQGERAAIAAMTVGLFAGGGAWWGHRKESEAWSDSPVQRLKITVRPEHGGARAALTLAF